MNNHPMRICEYASLFYWRFNLKACLVNSLWKYQCLSYFFDSRVWEKANNVSRYVTNKFFTFPYPNLLSFLFLSRITFSFRFLISRPRHIKQSIWDSFTHMHIYYTYIQVLNQQYTRFGDKIYQKIILFSYVLVCIFN